MSGLVLVADDLTGALDSAVSFCGSLGPIPVCLGATQQGASAHAAFDLATRDASAEFAVAATARIAGRMAGADIAYKKIDSLLRGHWAVELAGLIRTRAFGVCVFAPAFPSQGRTTRHGLQWVRGSDGTVTRVAIDPVETLERLGLRVARVAALDGESSVMAGDADVVVFDADTDDDLRRIARWPSLKRLPKPVLWCGSAGLARALAGQDPPRAGALVPPVLTIIGTSHAVSRAQIAQALNQRSTRHVALSGPQTAGAATQIAAHFEQSGGCLVTFELPDGMHAADAAVSIGQGLHGLLPLIPRPSSLVVAGGETLLSVCHAVGASQLEVNAEVSPGVPRSRLCGGLWDGVEVTSKSGGFGPPEWLAQTLAPSR